MENITITIRSPIYGTYVSVDKRKLDQASRENRLVTICVGNLGCVTKSAQEWWDMKDHIEKRDMKFKGNPMTFVYINVPIKSYYLKSKEIVPDQLSLL